MKLPCTGMSGRWLLSLGMSCLLLAVADATVGRASGNDGWPRVRLAESEEGIRVLLEGRHFTTFRNKGLSRPVLYPLQGPGGEHLTRRWPLEEPDLPEEKDHPHHKSLWYSHGEVNGEDLWSESASAGRTEHVRVVRMVSGDDFGELVTRSRWLGRDGNVLAEDVRTHRFHPADGETVWFDFEIRIHALDEDVVLGDTKEGTFAIRVAESMRVKQPRGRSAEGALVNSRGDRDGNAWGKRAEWADYSGPVQGRILGIAILDHPSNPRHPTWWHARDYGLFAANPFGVHDFERRPKGEGDLRIAAGSSLTFRYRVIIHPGDAESAGIANRYRVYAETGKGDRP